VELITLQRVSLQRWENSQNRCQSSCNGPYHTAEIWCDEIGLSVNLDKTELVIFTRRWKLLRFFEPLFLRGGFLSCCMSVKCLGVVLDSRPTWREHVDVKMRKAENMLWARRRACGATWPLSPKVVLRFYVSIIWRFITFASLVWWPNCQTANTKKRLSKLQ
jgi:hypothetical protein